MEVLILIDHDPPFFVFLPIIDFDERTIFQGCSATRNEERRAYGATPDSNPEKPQSSSCLIRRSASPFRPRNRFPLFFRLISRAREIRHQRPQSLAKKRPVADEKGGNKGKLESDVWIDSTIPLILIRFEVASAETVPRRPVLQSDEED